MRKDANTLDKERIQKERDKVSPPVVELALGLRDIQLIKMGNLPRPTLSAGSASI